MSILGRPDDILYTVKTQMFDRRTGWARTELLVYPVTDSWEFAVKLADRDVKMNAINHPDCITTVAIDRQHNPKYNWSF